MCNHSDSIGHFKWVYMVCFWSAVKCRPILHHCVFFIFLVLWDHGLYVVEKYSSAYADFSFPLINSLNKTEAAIFPMQTMLPEDFPLCQIIWRVLCFRPALHDAEGRVWRRLHSSRRLRSQQGQGGQTWWTSRNSNKRERPAWRSTESARRNLDIILEVPAYMENSKLFRREDCILFCMDWCTNDFIVDSYVPWDSLFWIWIKCQVCFIWFDCLIWNWFFSLLRIWELIFLETKRIVLARYRCVNYRPKLYFSSKKCGWFCKRKIKKKNTLS